MAATSAGSRSSTAKGLPEGIGWPGRKEKTAPESSMTYSISDSLNRVLTGTTIAPAICEAKKATHQLRPLPRRMATRSPLPTPISFKPPATRDARSHSSR
jgi:hypothetical protein